MKKKDGYFLVNIVGHPAPTLRFHAWSRCGSIQDGVGFAIGNEGGWVIEFKDLEQMYHAAKAARPVSSASEGR